MPEVTARIEGLRGVLDTLRQLPPEVVSKRGGPILMGLKRAGKIMQKEMRANVRKIVAEPNIGGRPTESTGALEKSITVRRRRGPEGGQRGEAVAIGPTRLGKKIAQGFGVARTAPSVYATFLEFGTERMRAHPFIRPAFETKRMEVLTRFPAEVQRAIDKVVRKLWQKNKGKK